MIINEFEPLEDDIVSRNMCVSDQDKGIDDQDVSNREMDFNFGLSVDGARTHARRRRYRRTSFVWPTSGTASARDFAVIRHDVDTVCALWGASSFHFIIILGPSLFFFLGLFQKSVENFQMD